LHEKALWFAGKGDWNTAHEIVQDMNDKFSSRIHAFLHRQEGDISNARYWYNRAGANMPALSINEEWEELSRNDTPDKSIIIPSRLASPRITACFGNNY